MATVNYGIYLLNIVALILLVTIVRRSAYMERKRNFKYDITALCVVVALLAVMGRDFAGTHNLYWMGVLTSILIDSASVIYFIFFIGSLVPWKNPVMWILEILGGLIIIAALLSIKTKWLYNIAPDGSFTQGPYYKLAALYLLVGFAVLIFVNFKKYRKCETEDIIRLVLLFSVEMIAIVLQLMESETFQDGFIGSALLIILYYDFVTEIESKYDKLTNVGSYTYFKAYVDRLKRKDAYSLLMFDVNGLKRVNDTLGHGAGDKLISAVAGGIKEAVEAGNSKGKVFRIGGDEFMVVMLTADEAVVNEIATKANALFEEKSQELGMVISAAAGATIRQPGEDVRDAMARADEKMYACKQLYYQQDKNNRRR